MAVNTMTFNQLATEGEMSVTLGNASINELGQVTG